jgi:hypothetical protein
MAPPKEISESKLLLAEGADAYYFCVWAYQALKLSNIQVLDFGGITELRAYLKQLTLLYGYENVDCIVIARDAEQNAAATESSVKTALSHAGLAVPGHPFEFSSGKPRVAFMLFPGYTLDPATNESSLENGALEDLCLEIANDKGHLQCVDQYLECLQSIGRDLKYPHKAKVHSYLAGKDALVGLKIGEAARVGAWDWQHPRFAQFKRIISSM